MLDWALHLDESTPHIHERHVFDCENKYGEVAPQQEKALEALGFDLPDPDKPLSRRNNRKITFDAACRKMLFEIAKRHGLELEEEAEYGNRKYLEKQDFILAKQKEQLAAQQNKLDELTLKVNDMETLIDEVSAAAYDKAVEVVTDVVRTETRKEDMPSLGMLTINALAAADTTLIPVQAQYLSAKGLEQLLRTVGKVRRQINPKLKIEGILLTMTDSRTNYGKQIDTLIRQAYGSKIKVFDQTIPRSVRAAETSAAGKSIFQHDPKGKVAEAYQSLAREVLADAEKRIKRSSERAR